MPTRQQHLLSNSPTPAQHQSLILSTLPSHAPTLPHTITTPAQFLRLWRTTSQALSQERFDVMLLDYERLSVMDELDFVLREIAVAHIRLAEEGRTAFEAANRQRVRLLEEQREVLKVRRDVVVEMLGEARERLDGVMRGRWEELVGRVDPGLMGFLAALRGEGEGEVEGRG